MSRMEGRKEDGEKEGKEETKTVNHISMELSLINEILYSVLSGPIKFHSKRSCRIGY